MILMKIKIWKKERFKKFILMINKYLIQNKQNLRIFLLQTTQIMEYQKIYNSKDKFN